MTACKDCGKEFDQRDSLEQHYSAVHAKKPQVSHKAPKKSKKKFYGLASVLIILVLGYFIFSGSDESTYKPTITGDEISINLDEVPSGPIHWHPTLSIIINGERVKVPGNIGATSSIHGAGGGYMAPIHTHDATGTLHMEMTRPTAETVTLGYFINDVWKKTFNSNCLYDSCNGPEGSLKLTVNGEPNFKFDKYVMKDKDNIVIEFSNVPMVITEENTPEESTESQAISEKTEEPQNSTESTPEVITEETPHEEPAEAQPVLKEFSMTAKKWDFTPNTITVNQGDTIKLNITSIDVAHGIALPDFGINEFLSPGKSTEIEFVANKKGNFSFFCSVQCGLGHGNMRGNIVVS